MAPPPSSGYTTNSANAQYNNLLGRPQVVNKPPQTMGAMAPGTPGLSTNPLATSGVAQRMQQMVKLLSGGKA